MSSNQQGELLTEVRTKFYLDSVALMRHSRALASREGVIEAAMMMGTPANREIMQNAGLLDAASPAAGGGDLVISIRATSLAVAREAVTAADELLEKPATVGSGSEWRPRSIRSAVAMQPDANLVLISVAGDFAVSEARKALRRGLHAMIFSDNVSIQAEVELKQEARSLGRIVMGPDCGTSIINGVPLAFANKLPRGAIGIVGASGTGIQEVSCLIAANGQGISHAIGVGGRDLKSEVGGLSTLMALEALGRDDQTQQIVLISKPPADKVVEKILPVIATIGKPVVLCFVGGSEPVGIPAGVTFTNTLKAAAEAATATQLQTRKHDIASLVKEFSPSRKRVIGLYCGGTLCAEAQVILSQQETAVASNVAIPGVQDSAGELLAVPDCHVLSDLGDDRFTRGRPHPMIEPSIRDDALGSALSSPDVAVVLLDVVIGYGAHADPAGQIAGVLQHSGWDNNGPLVIASVTGTVDDPQNLSRQEEILARAGVLVTESNADAVALGMTAVRSVRATSDPVGSPA
ncbi:MAG: acyl-CoA synthetase FdrA [Gammaproteobacteria bacterium]|nr:acyl-CoA synthetase FdrA [Gammaproteobacteria bacterium]